MNCEVNFTLSEGCGTHELYFQTGQVVHVPPSHKI